MKFQLFRKIGFTITDPIALVEAFCSQSDFYANFDAAPVRERQIEHVNRIGARIDSRLLADCKRIIENTKSLGFFGYDNDLDSFLRLDTKEMNELIEEFNQKAVKGLLKKGIGLSKATKVLHTFHPETVPMIDNPLQKLYLERINSGWVPGDPHIFTDYYTNFLEGGTWKNLNAISAKLSGSSLTLTRVRIFDILWWSCLKSRTKMPNCRENSARLLVGLRSK